MKLFGKKISIGKTIKNIAGGIVKGASAIIKTVAPVVKTVFPASAGVVDKVTGFLGKNLDKVKEVQNVIKINPTFQNTIEQVEEYISDGGGSAGGSNSGNSGRGGSNSLASKSGTDEPDPNDQADNEFQIKIGKFPKLMAILFALWKLFGGNGK